MCRYASRNYRSNFICLNCRIAMKRFPVMNGERITHRCGNCDAELIDMGHDFHAPRRGNDNQWRKLDKLVSAGVTFSSCGCRGPGPRPKTLADTKRYLKNEYRVRL